MSTLSPAPSEMTAVVERTRDQGPPPVQFLTRLFALPAVHDAFTVASDRYQLTKIRLRHWNGVIDVMEGLVKNVTCTATHYIATPLVSHVGGWQTVDEWACRGLNKLEAMAPIIKRPTQEIKQTVLLKLQAFLEEETPTGDGERGAVITEIQDDGSLGLEETSTDSENAFTGLETTAGVGDEESLLLKNRDARETPEELDLEDHSSESLELEGNENPTTETQDSKKDSKSLEEKIPWWKRFFQRLRPNHPKESPETISGGENEKVKNGEDTDKIAEEEDAQLTDKELADSITEATMEKLASDSINKEKKENLASSDSIEKRKKEKLASSVSIEKEKENLASDSIQKEKRENLASDSIEKDQDNLASDSIEKHTENLASDSIEKHTENLASDSIEKENLASDSKEKGNLASDSIEKENLASDSIEKENLASDSIEKKNLTSDSIEKEKEKLASDLIEKEKENLASDSIEQDKHTSSDTVDDFCLKKNLENEMRNNEKSVK